MARSLTFQEALRTLGNSLEAHRMEVSAGGELVLDDTVIRGQIATLRMRRGTGTPAPQRPKSAFWRRD